MKRIAILLPVMMLAGCATPQTIVQTRTVNVPVPVPCKVPDTKPPTWALDTLPANATLYERVRAMAAEITQRQGFETRLQAAAKSCG